MTSANRRSPQVQFASQYVIRNFFRVENVVSVRKARSIHAPPRVTYADSCTLVHYDNDVSPGFYCYDAEGTAPHIHDIIGPAHSRVIQCPKSTPHAGSDQGAARFQEVADVPVHGNGAREAL
eukprot:5153047-Pyramimonas_sp.AAC.2